jgi:hypothetical protein
MLFIKIGYQINLKRILLTDNILPNTEWQHITFTMPSEFWDLFWLNRGLLNSFIFLVTRL